MKKKDIYKTPLEFIQTRLSVPEKEISKVIKYLKLDGWVYSCINHKVYEVFDLGKNGAGWGDVQTWVGDEDKFNDIKKKDPNWFEKDDTYDVLMTRVIADCVFIWTTWKIRFSKKKKNKIKGREK